jgi:hypothetical protein
VLNFEARARANGGESIQRSPHHHTHTTTTRCCCCYAVACKSKSPKAVHIRRLLKKREVASLAAMKLVYFGGLEGERLQSCHLRFWLCYFWEIPLEIRWNEN